MANTKSNNHKLKYDVLVEKAGAKGYTARSLLWPDLVAEASTRDQVLKQIRLEMLKRLAKAEIVTLEFTPEEVNNPWLKFAGMWADNPDFDEFVEEIERYRREIDEEQSPLSIESEIEDIEKVVAV